MDSLDVNLSGRPLRRDSQEYEPSEMQAGKYLVNLNTTDDPPKALKINEGDQTRWLNELKHYNEKPKRKLVTNEIFAETLMERQTKSRGRRSPRQLCTSSIIHHFFLWGVTGRGGT